MTIKPINRALQAMRNEMAKGVTDRDDLITAAEKVLDGDTQTAARIYTRYFEIMGPN